MKYFKYKEHKVWYSRMGKGIPMIFLHNGGNDHRIWDFQVKKFSGNHEIILLDLPGYGKSDRPEINYSLHLYCDMITEFIKKLRLPPPILVGNCIGSATSLLYGLKNPARVRALVLFNIATEGILQSGSFGQLYRTITKHDRVRDAIKIFADAYKFTTIVKAFGVRRLYGKTGDRDSNFHNYIISLYSEMDQVRVLYNLLYNFGSFRQLDDITRPDNFPPCCVLWGAENHILPLGKGEEYCSHLQPDHLAVMEKCGHLLMREKPEEINTIIEEFLFRNNALYKKKHLRS